LKEEVLKIIENPDLSFSKRIDSIERLLMIESLEKNKWIKLKAAKELEVTYRIFNYKFDKYGLQKLNPRKRKKRKSEKVKS